MLVSGFEKKNNEIIIMKEFNGKVGFAIGTGRCGTSFLAKALSLEPNVSTVDERNALNETFHRYCKWYGLPVDHEGFLHTKEVEIKQDLFNHIFSFESSAYLSLSVQELFQRFGAKFILMVHSPELVVNSYLKKGWYDKPIVRENAQLALGYQEVAMFHHFFGRIVPSGEYFIKWQQMNRIGKLGWYWNTLNACVLEQFEKIPETHWRVQKLEGFSYEQYLEITRFLGIQSSLTRGVFNKLVNKNSNVPLDEPTIKMWSGVEITEFESQVESMAKKLDFEYRVDRLPVPLVRPPSPLPHITLKFRQISAPIKRLVMGLK